MKFKKVVSIGYREIFHLTELWHLPSSAILSFLTLASAIAVDADKTQISSILLPDFVVCLATCLCPCFVSFPDRRPYEHVILYPADGPMEWHGYVE